MDPLLGMSVELAKAHLSASSVDTAQIPTLIRDIYNTLKELSGDNQAASSAPETRPTSPAPANGVAPIINSDISGPEFEGLDPWLAARVPRRVARELNRQPSIHPSVFDDYLICLEDGQKVKLLRAYVRNRFGLSMSEYLDRWNLPSDYPIAPPSFLAAKRATAKAAGLGVTTRAPRGPRKQRVGRAPSAKKETTSRRK